MTYGQGGARIVERPRYLLVAAVAVFNVLGAGFGAVGLATGWLTLDATATARLPWGSGVLAGIALAVVVAVPNALVVAVAGRRDARCGPASIAAGVLLMGWITVEFAVIRELSFFHPTYLAIGVVQVWLGTRVVRANTGITGRDLWREVRNVLVDVPVFLSSPLYRRRHLTWNATRPEVEGPMPGDELLPRPSYVSTRAITIDAPPDKVWPWLVQVGCLRAGWYSDDLLDNLGRPSSQTLVPALQHIEVGQLIPMSPTPTVATSFRVVSYAAPHDLLWATRDSTWAWQLNEQAAGRTRVVTRIRATRDWRRPGAALLSVLLLEFGDFAMLRRMLKGIKQRSEANQRPQ